MKLTYEGTEYLIERQPFSAISGNGMEMWEVEATDTDGQKYRVTWLFPNRMGTIHDYTDADKVLDIVPE